MASFSAGTTFTDGVANDVTAAKLGALVNNATPTSGLIQDRTAETITATNDTLLIGDASDSNNLKRITVANFAQTLPTAKVTTGTIDTATLGTTTGTAATFTTGTITTLTAGTTTSTAATITTGTIPTLTAGTTTSTAATITTGTIPTLTAGTTTSTAATITTGTIPTLVATTLITSGTGTAAAPAIVPTGDTNTGFLFPDSDSVAISTQGTERVRVDANGNFGIGTPTPSTKLDVNGNITIPTTGFISSGDSSGEIYIFAGGSRRGGQIDFKGGTAAADAGTLIFRAGTGAGSAAQSERMRVTASGEVYIAGTTDQGAYNLQVNGTGVWGAGAYVNGSDERLKENIQDITSGLDVVEKLRPVSFQYKEEYTADRSVQSGFIAQDLLVALEGKNYLEGVVSQGPTYYNVAYQNLIPILAKAIQELKSENDSLKTRIEALEAA